MAETKQKTFSDSLMKGDRTLWGVYLTLLVISVIEMYSASSSLAYRAASNTDPVLHHTLFLIAGFIGVIIVQHFRTETIRNWGLIFLLTGFLLMLATLFFGEEHQGARREILGIQPAELCKVGLMITLSHVLSVSQRDSGGVPVRRFWIMIGLVAAVCLPIATQNLSTAIIIAFASLCTMLLGGVQWRYIGLVVLTAAAFAGLCLGLLWLLHESDMSRQAEGKERINLSLANRAHAWADRIYSDDAVALWDEDLDGERSQELYAHMAVANSYPLGHMPGNSQTRDFLPEAYSDYIFAIIFEELGIFGAVLVIVLYIGLLIRAFFIARRNDNLLSRLIVISLAILIVTQALIHIGVCTGAMFVTGQPLPLISRGGSSILATSFAFGVLFSISRPKPQMTTAPDGKFDAD